MPRPSTGTANRVLYDQPKYGEPEVRHRDAKAPLRVNDIVAIENGGVVPVQNGSVRPSMLRVVVPRTFPEHMDATDQTRPMDTEPDYDVGNRTPYITPVQGTLVKLTLAPRQSVVEGDWVIPAGWGPDPVTPGCVAQWRPAPDDTDATATREDVVGVVVSDTSHPVTTDDDETATITVIAEHPIRKADPVEEKPGSVFTDESEDNERELAEKIARVQGRLDESSPDHNEETQ